jgi:hypothetical protein
LSVKLRSRIAGTVVRLAVITSVLCVLSMVSGPQARSSTMGPAVLASTTACGSACTSPVNQDLGTTETPTITITGSGCPAVTATGLETAAGESACTIKVAMATTTTTNAGQDWVAMEEGTVDKFISDDALSQRLDIQYGSDEVVEFEAAPDGVASNLCLAIVSGAATLQQCGGATSVQTDSESGSESDTSSSTTTGTDNDYNNVQLIDGDDSAYVSSSTNYPDDSTSGTDSITSKGTDTTVTSTYSGTAWILDSGDTANGYLDVISGSDQSYSDPLVLTAASSGALSLTSLSAVGGVVTNTQMWAFEYESTSAATIKKDGVQRT